MGHGDSADLLEVTTPVLSSESLSGDAINLQSAASINVVGIDKLQVEPSRLIYEIAVTPRYNLCLNKQPSLLHLIFLQVKYLIFQGLPLESKTSTVRQKHSKTHRNIKRKNTNFYSYSS